MIRARLLEDFKAVTADLNTARRALANEQFRARHGMAHNIMHAAQVEHTTYYRWQRIGESLANCR